VLFSLLSPQFLHIVDLSNSETRNAADNFFNFLGILFFKKLITVIP